MRKMIAGLTFAAALCLAVGRFPVISMAAEAGESASEESSSEEESDSEECGHDYQLDEEKSSEPTCTEAGTYYYVCTQCGDEKTETVEATGHNWILGEIADANCAGMSYYMYMCRECRETYYEYFQGGLGHYDSVLIADYGDRQVYGCSYCGEITEIRYNDNYLKGTVEENVSEGNVTADNSQSIFKAGGIIYKFYRSKGIAKVIGVNLKG